MENHFQCSVHAVCNLYMRLYVVEMRSSCCRVKLTEMILWENLHVDMSAFQLFVIGFLQ